MEKVTNRLRRVVLILERNGIEYAVIGGNAVAAWVASVEESAARNTQDVDILVNRGDLSRLKLVLEREGFVYRRVAGIDLFLDCAEAKARDAVHLIFAGEKVRSEYEIPAPDVSEAELLGQGWRVLSLPSLVRMKLTSFRRKDQVHLLDLIGVGLIGEKDLDGLPPLLEARLKELLDDPEG